ncbi:recombinase family protein [Clostridium perfringens]|uniref:recombinase family protein n=1 Tax=Clostridium perfringens TaxID=1502 RepID=UPI002AC54F6A|nr:recombinase family protein [Clostridium perfringens]MDZ5063932.1 recombinase family protein [Clostridium perfringens]
MIYGYARVSTKQQSIERQIRNIKQQNNGAMIFQEKYTGTKIDGREEFKKLLTVVKQGDTIIFDSVSRMSRNAEEGFELYKELFNKGVELIFIKESYINTSTYKSALETNIKLTGTIVDSILEGVNKYLMQLAEEQIKIAFNQAEKEVEDLRQRTREGLVTAKIEGKKVGREKGDKLTTKKSVESKKLIRKYSKEFEGSLTDKDCIKLIGISRNSYYKYKREMLEG